MKNKNYSIIIAIALIALLVVAMICMGCDKKNNIDTPVNDVEQNEIDSGEKPMEVPEVPDVNQNVEWDENGAKVNVSENINKEKMTFGDIDLTDITFKFSNGVTEFNANVNNNSEKDYPMGMEMKIIFYDNEKNVIFDTYAMTSSLPANGSSSIQANFLYDCSYADTFEIIIVE